MRRRSNHQRFWQIMLGLLLITIGLASLSGGRAIPLILGLLGFYLLMQEFSQSAAQIPPRDTVSQRADSASLRRAAEEQASHYALRAARRAGVDLDRAAVLPIDIGLAAFDETGSAAALYQSSEVFKDFGSAVQPYIRLYLPRRAKGRIRFELVDAAGGVVFVHEGVYTLEPGANLISPPARLPLRDPAALRGRWELRVTADGVLIAVHPFRWSYERAMKPNLRLASDGEISPEHHDLLAEDRFEPLSLDDLLADQEAEQERQRRARR
jgi:hypothetical protein